MNDNIPEDIKLNRLQQIIDNYHEILIKKNTLSETNEYRLILIEGYAKKSTDSFVMLTGRTDGNKRVVFTIGPDLDKNFKLDKTSVDTSHNAYKPHNDIRDSFTQHTAVRSRYLVFSSYDAYNKIVQQDNMLSKALSYPFDVYPHNSSDISSLPKRPPNSKAYEIQFVSNQFQCHLLKQAYIHDKTCIQSISTSFNSSSDGNSEDIPVESLFGQYAIIKIIKANGPTLRGILVALSSITECSKLHLPY